MMVILCVDNDPHKFIFLRSESLEVGWHRWKKVDTFYCEKCLQYETISSEIIK